MKANGTNLKKRKRKRYKSSMKPKGDLVNSEKFKEREKELKIAYSLDYNAEGRR